MEFVNSKVIPYINTLLQTILIIAFMPYLN